MFIVAEWCNTEFVQRKCNFFLASESHLLAQLPIEPELEQLYQNLEISSELVSLTAEGYSVVVILI